MLLVVPLTSWAALRTGLLVGALVAIAVEIVRLRTPTIRARLALLIPLYRASEARRPSGAMWLVVGFAVAACFPAPAPAAGILVGALADPAASLGGSLVRTAAPKTWAGTGAHFAVSAVSLTALLGQWHIAGVAALVGAVVERWSGRFNDNVTVPPAVALVVTLVG